MRRGQTMGLRAAILLVVVVAATAVGIFTPTMSNEVEKDVQVSGPAITLTVEGIPATVSPGDYFRVVATLSNQANRPVPAVLRFEVRNPNSTTPDELTIYGGCGAEEVVSSRTLRYYLGWHGPLLAAKGVSYPAGTSLATIDAALGDAEYWPMVRHEVQGRDPQGYASLISPGANASGAIEAAGSDLLRTLYYFGMVELSAGSGASLSDWTLAVPFSDRFVASGGPSQEGFLVEVHPQARGSYEFRFWAERPDALGMPSHPSYTCGPL